MSGFIGDRALAWIKEVRSRDPEWFELAEDVNDFGHEILLKLIPNNQNGLQVLSSILYKRALCAFQAVIILAERGMYTEASVQRRSLLEALFILGGIWQKPNLIEEYIKSDVHRRLNIYKNIKDMSKERRGQIASWISDDELKRTIGELEIKAKSVRYCSLKVFAQAAQLYDLYLSDYCILSEVAHHASKDLERSISIDSSEDIDSLLWGPEPEQPFNILFPSIDQMLMATHVISKIYKINVKKRFKQFSETSRSLSEIAELREANNSAADGLR